MQINIASHFHLETYLENSVFKCENQNIVQ